MIKEKVRNRKICVLLVCAMLFICGGVGFASATTDNVMIVEAKTPCKHTRGYARFGKAVGNEKKTINNDNEYCYKTRKYYKQKCVDCGKTMSTYSFDAWKKHKHDYWFLKKYCNECGRRK